ncbi:MAG: flagellar filament capping protein FliD [Spirochaetaceae bacterium]|jgi:flagellar hook-associated protein 2|nr:flagellar filament capping protein FliD [Spirochaetaceae bacterium]
MSDIYIPGVKSRFNTDTLIEELMKVERIPKDRSERQIETLETEKGYWQEIGRRIGSLRESARSLFSFQNPFNERIARSSDESVLSAAATRQAVEQERSFIVKQVAKADRFLSNPLDPSFRVKEGTYTFMVGNDQISFNYRGGTLADFTEVLNRRGRGKVQASVLSVESGTKSLLIESLVPGSQNRLSFSGAAEDLVQSVGIGRRSQETSEPSLPDRVALTNNTLTVEAGKTQAIEFPQPARDLSVREGILLSFETSTTVSPPETGKTVTAPSGPRIPGAGSASYGGITIENDNSSVSLPEWIPPPAPVRVDDSQMLFLRFTDGSSASLPLIQDSSGFIPGTVQLDELGGGKAVAALEIVNNNTHRDLSIRNVSVHNPRPAAEFRAGNAISTAQDAIIVMEGIEIKRPSNDISDLIPGVTVTAKAASDKPVTLAIEPDREAVKDAIITLVGNYNRLMAELNVLTRTDDRIVQELNYMTAEEQAELRNRLGSFSGDSMLNQFKNNLQRAVTNPYPTQIEENSMLLVQIGVGTDLRRAGASTGYDPARLRGYLEIDEKILDAALQKDLRPIQQLFGLDTDGDLIVDSGVAYSLDTLVKPYVETGGVISLKTGTIDSRIDQEKRRIATLDRQLEAKEDALKRQYGRMESAYNRMQEMGTSLDNFSRQANSINGSR